VCSYKENRGLGVRKLKEFNVALLGKWCLRMLMERDGLWYHVLVARYSDVGGRLEEGGRSCSSWWKEVGRIREGSGDVGVRLFGDNVVRKVGDGTDTLFWSHRWLGGAALSERFPRLYELAENKMEIVASMFSLGLGQGGDGWRWRRRLWVWEENLLEECRAFLLDVSLFPNVSDVWVWLPDPVGGYSVRGAYDLLTSPDITHMEGALDLV
jgi:hypothetical protein